MNHWTSDYKSAGLGFDKKPQHKKTRHFNGGG